VKRIFAILMVALFMVSVMIVMTAPAFAAHKFTPPNKTNACQGPNDQPNCPSPR